ncbi:34276_t:CDS:1, partial [Gigaspora margarita]
EFLKFASSVMGAGLQGGLFSLDGKITTYLKSPFGQICFAINKSKLIEGEEADEIVEDLTEINEQCKETLKKFGVLTLAQRLLKFLEAG